MNQTKLQAYASVFFFVFGGVKKKEKFFYCGVPWEEHIDNKAFYCHEMKNKIKRSACKTKTKPNEDQNI